MAVRRTTIEIDEALAERAVAVTGATLRATVEQGLRLVVDAGDDVDERRRAQLGRHLANAARGVDIDVLLSAEAWR